MPSASVSTATAVKPGFFSNWRKANFKSFMVRGQLSVVPCQSQGKLPKPKAQAPKKSQAAKPQPAPRYCDIGTWNLELGTSLGIWVLGFGVFIRISAPPSDRP